MEQVRAVAARLINAESMEIALVPNTTAGIGLVAAAIIVDLVARLDHLDAQLAQQRGRA